MGATYSRQSSYTDGDTITAAHTNNEFDQLLAAFAASTGHTHDGTTAEGGPITKLLGTSITMGDGTAGTDITVTFDGESNDGVFKWMEDEDYFEFSDDILIAAAEKLQFRDSAIYINSSADGQLDLVADTEIQIAATTIDMNGNADISGNLGVGGNLTVTGTTTFNGGTITMGDAATDNVVFGADVNSSIIPNTDSTYDLGSSSQEWRDLYIDGTAYVDAINYNGTAISATAAELNIMDGVTATTAELNIMDGVTATAAELNILDGVTSTAAELNIIDGDTSATSTTVVDADRVVFNDNGTMVQVAVTDLAAYFDDEITAMPNLVSTGALNSGSITSGFGTVDTGSSTITTTGLISGGSLDIDNVLINGTTIGHTDDTDLITVASGLVTVAGEVSMTTLDIGGTNVSSTAAELNILDGVTSTATELNIMDGDTSAGTTAVAGGDGIVTNDNGTMRQTTIDTFDTYLSATTKTLTNKTLTTPTLTTPVANAGVQLKNGSTSAGFLEFFEDSDNGTNKVTLIGPASTADITLTLPSTAGTLATTASVTTVAQDEATALAIALG